MSAQTTATSTQNYGTWRSFSGVVHHVPYTYKHVLFVEKDYWNPHFVHRMINNYWHSSIAISLIYFAVIYLLHRWMSNRKPYDLRGLMAAWNGTLAVFSAIGFLRMGEEFLYVLRERTFKDSVCLSVDPNGPSAFWALLFSLSKVAELIDTVFVILRKRPLIFLHWYHHAAVLVYSWHAACVVTAAGRWFMVMNYFVHALMYSYYGLSSLRIRLPKSISMTITVLQTLQMFVGVAISVYVARLKYMAAKSSEELICMQTDENLALCFAIYISFAILFINFFCSAYLSSKKHKKSSAANGKAANGQLKVE